jgi:hypothetical protein
MSSVGGLGDFFSDVFGVEGDVLFLLPVFTFPVGFNRLEL